MILWLKSSTLPLAFGRVGRSNRSELGAIERCCFWATYTPLASANCNRMPVRAMQSEGLRGSQQCEPPMREMLSGGSVLGAAHRKPFRLLSQPDASTSPSTLYRLLMLVFDPDCTVPVVVLPVSDSNSADYPTHQ